MLDDLDRTAGRGVAGVRRLRGYLHERGGGRAAGSPAEVELFEALVRWGIEPPVRQLAIELADGSVAVVDAGWPARRKLLEVDGFDGHSSPHDLEASDSRQNAILEAGYELRRYSGRAIRRDPLGVARQVHRYLLAPSGLWVPHPGQLGA